MPDETPPNKIKGKIPYNSMSSEIFGFVEMLAPGCFAESLRGGGYEGDVIARHEHDSRALLGRRSAGTLRLDDSADALRFEVDLPKTSAGADVAELSARGDLKNASFCFLVEDYDADEQWTVTPAGTLLRTVMKAQLLEVSPVAEPAYPASELAPA